MLNTFYGAILVSLSFSTIAFAASNLETIKDLYNNSTTAAAVTDFPERNYKDGTFVQPQNVACSIIDGTDQPFGFDVSRTIRTTPPYGPLIPGKTEEKLTFGDVRVSYNLIKEPTVNSADLVVVNPIYRTWVDSNTGVKYFVPATLRARKSGDYTAFQVSVIHNSSMVQDEFYYGYCYPIGQALF